MFLKYILTLLLLYGMIVSNEISEKGYGMGMTNEQFDSYKKRLLRELEDIAEETPNPKLQRLIEDFREELGKP